MDALLRERQVRAARNRSLFREVNERIEMIGTAVHEQIGYVCECLDLECNEQIHLTIDEYEAVRAAGGDRFFVKPGHAEADIELIVGNGAGHVVVEMVDVGAEVARTLDQRSVR
jgi:hypothetical protein